MTTTTYEFTAFTESDIIAAGANSGNYLSIGETITLTSAPGATVTVTDDDIYLSGDYRSNENADDTTYQTADIADQYGNELGNGGQIYAEQYYWVYDQYGNWYVMFQIEQEGSGEKFYSFYNSGGYTVPAEDAVLTVNSYCNVTSEWLQYCQIDSGEAQTAPVATGLIGGRAFTDADRDNTEWNADTGTWEEGEANLTVTLYKWNGSTADAIATTTTDSNGVYSFGELESAWYYVKFTKPDGTEFVQQDVGPEGEDSDVNAYGNTNWIWLNEGEQKHNVDAGFVAPPAIDAVDDEITVLETEGAGDFDGNVLENDTSDFGAIDAVLRVQGQEANVGEWIDLAGGGRVRLMENGDLDFDANGDFVGLAEGEVAMRNFTYTIAYSETSTQDDYQCLFFGEHPAGTIIDDEYAANGVTISGFRSHDAGLENPPNAVMVFDTSNPTGGDLDLSSSTRGNVLIISEDFDGSDPDDEAHGGTFIFDFHGEANVESLVFLDTEEPQPEIRLYDAAGNLITTILGPVTTDGGEGFANINVAGVHRMEVQLQGSGAIDNLIYSLTTEQTVIVDEDTANVKVNIVGINDLDDGDEFAEVSEASGVTALADNALANAVDPDGGAPVVVTVDGVALNGGSASVAGNAGGIFTFNADGTVSFDTDGAFAYLSEGQKVVTAVTYEVADGQGGLVTSTYSVTVTGTEGEPIIDAMDDSYVVFEDEGAGDSEGNVLDNDDLPFAGENLVVEVNGQSGAVGEWIDLAGGGRVKLNANGEIDFDANGAYDGLAEGESAFETLNYTVRSTDDVQDSVVAIFEGPNGLAATAEIVELNGNLVVTLTVQTQGGDIGDIRGFFFDVSDESLLSGMSASGADITDQEFEANNVFNLGGGNNVNGDIIIELGKFDGGVTAGTSGIGSDDIRSTTFTLSHSSVALGLDLLLNQDMALRLTSVGEEGGSRGDSLKLGSVGLPNTAPSLVDTANVQIEIVGLNELADGDEVASVDEGSGVTVLAVNALDNTIDEDVGSVPVVTPISGEAGSNGGLFSIDANGQITFDTNGDFSYLAEGESAVTAVTYTVTDGQGGEVQSSVTITVNGVNSLGDGDEAASVDEGSGVTVLGVNALDNTVDPDGGTPAVTPISNVAGSNGGLFSIDAAGQITFDTNGDFNTLGLGDTATTTVTYTVTDGQGGEVQSNVTITVNGVNDLEDGDEFATVNEDAAPTQLDNALLNTVDPDSDPTSIKVATLAGAALVAGTATAGGSNGGSFTFLEDGTVTFAANGDFDALQPGEAMTTSVSYQVSDGDGGLVTSTYTVEVVGVNDAPVAVANSYFIEEGTALTGANIITDPDQSSDIGGEVDSDPNGDALVISSALGKDVNGDLTVNIVSTDFVTVYTDGGVAVEVKLDSAGNLEVSDNTEVGPGGDVISLTYTVEDIPANGDVKVSNEASVTVGITDTTGQGPEGPEVNVVFLLDASDLAVSANSSAFAVGDLNGDGKANSIFDASIDVLQDAIASLTSVLGATGDVDVGVYSFESQITSTPNEFTPAVALQEGGETVFDLSTDFGSVVSNVAVNTGVPFGDNGSDIFDNGAAFMAAAMEAANSFISANDQSAASGGEAINLVYVIGGSVGADIGNDYIGQFGPGTDGNPDGFDSIAYLEGLADPVGQLFRDANLDPNSDVALTNALLESQQLGLTLDTLYFGSDTIALNSGLYALEHFQPDQVTGAFALSDGVINEGLAGKTAFLDNIVTDVNSLIDDLLA